MFFKNFQFINNLFLLQAPTPEVITERLPEPVRHEVVLYNPHQGNVSFCMTTCLI